jgi:dimethylaniline monooxygenase (N-oxide forming)
VTPAVPDIPGIEHVLDSRQNADIGITPRVFHSIDYKFRSQLTGRRVMILGTGETGMDLAYEAVKAGANEVVLCSRSGYVSAQFIHPFWH